MSIEIEINEKDITEFNSKIGRFNEKINDGKILKKIAIIIKNKIFVTTQSGKDFKLKSFKPYSKKYASKEGKTTVNLTQTGEMLNQMTQILLTNQTAKIFFATKDARNRARWHNVEGAGKSKVIRVFFGVTDNDEKKSRDLYDKEIKRIKEKERL